MKYRHSNFPLKYIYLKNAVSNVLSLQQWFHFLNKLWAPPSLRLLVSAGFRSRCSGRMAGWMWLRCVLGPHLQRIHRSPDHSQPEGRVGRRVRISAIDFVYLKTHASENWGIFNIIDTEKLRLRPGSVRCLLLKPFNALYMEGKWMKLHAHWYTSLVTSSFSLFHPRSFHPTVQQQTVTLLFSDINLVMLTLTGIQVRWNCLNGKRKKEAEQKTNHRNKYMPLHRPSKAT